MLQETTIRLSIDGPAPTLKDLFIYQDAVLSSISLIASPWLSIEWQPISSHVSREEYKSDSSQQTYQVVLTGILTVKKSIYPKDSGCSLAVIPISIKD